MLTEGAKLQCSCGSSLSDLKVTSHNFNYICSFLQATEHDNKAGENIFPFGICSKTQKSCHPTPLDWKSKIEWMDIKGSAAITDQSTLPCALGGIISCKENTQYSWAIRHKEEEETPEEDYDFWDEEEEEEEPKDWEPGYILISTLNDFGANVFYKYDLEGNLYSQIDNAAMDEEKFKSTVYKGRLNKLAQKTYEDLELLRANSEGKKLLEFFENGKHVVKIYIPNPEQTNGVSINHSDEKQINYMGRPEELPMEGYFDRIEVPSYIVLGHEMGHVKSYSLKLQDTTFWIEDRRVMIDEIYASHIENKIRAAAGINLRDKYDGSGETDLLDKQHNNLYINRNEDNYPSNPPKKIEAKNAYNYNSIKKDE